MEVYLPSKLWDSPLSFFLLDSELISHSTHKATMIQKNSAKTCRLYQVMSKGCDDACPRDMIQNNMNAPYKRMQVQPKMKI
mmetsp:Transcript_47885/g.150200  ORF Transcript_47885/g.150200 Transcript_47885/m.150200 type:complete len:81 (-) Transcript_47885:211-453(-)